MAMMCLFAAVLTWFQLLEDVHLWSAAYHYTADVLTVCSLGDRSSGNCPQYCCTRGHILHFSCCTHRHLQAGERWEMQVAFSWMLFSDCEFLVCCAFQIRDTVCNCGWVFRRTVVVKWKRLRPTQTESVLVSSRSKVVGWVTVEMCGMMAAP